MATYASYKKVANDSIVDGTITSDDIAHGNGNNYGVQWIHNERGMRCHECARQSGCCEQANGKCCYWCVPDGVSTVTFEIWSGGGGGPGSTCCNYCMFTIGGAGGNYASKTIATNPYCRNSYVLVAVGLVVKHTLVVQVWDVRVTPTDITYLNFRAVGGCGGWMCNGDAWGPKTYPILVVKTVEYVVFLVPHFGIMGSNRMGTLTRLLSLCVYIFWIRTTTIIR